MRCSIALLALCAAFFSSSPVLSSPARPPHDDELLVSTSSGPIHGFYNDTAHKVRGFLGVPYAQPPLGENRFRAPVHLNKRNSKDVLVADHYTSICPGQYNNQTSLYTILPYHGVTPQDEDCLTLNIWAPSTHRKQTTGNATVMVFIFGGGFFQGGSSDPFIDGATIVSEQEDLIFVNFNYRLSILGFSAAPYLDPKEWNVGLLDQRAAVEWIYNNIAAFGGDPNKIMLMGQSAGSYSVDLYLDAWAADPIIHGASMLSGANLGDGSVFGPAPTPGVGFTEVAAAQGCSNATTTPEEEFKCMQTKDVFAMLHETTVNFAHEFGPLVDNVTCFSNASERIVTGLTAKVPLLLGDVADEGFAFIPWSPTGENATLDAYWNQQLKCAVSDEANLRVARPNSTVFRYYYTGVYHNNLSPYPWLGTYHSSDYPMILGTVDPVLGNVTTAQRAQLEYMQGAWVAFARDPHEGLVKYGWSKYGGKHGGATVANLAPNNGTGPDFVQFVDPGTLDQLC